MKRERIPYGLILLAAFALSLAAGCANDGGRGSPPKVPAGLRAAFAARLDSLAAEAGIPGASAAFILPDGAFAAFAWGLADSASGAPMTTGTRIICGSIGKTWLGATAAGLAADGVIDLDAPLSRYLGAKPWFSRLPNANDLTLRRLMNHASGVPDHLDRPEYMEALRGVVACGDPDSVFTHEQLVSYVLDLEPLHPAGGDFRYADMNYILAGLAVEAATGEVYDEMMRGNLTRIIGLKSTGPTVSRYLEGLACGYLEADNVFGLPAVTLADDGFLNHNPAVEWTGGGVVTTPGDLARWARMLWSGRLLGPEATAELLRGHPRDPGDPALGDYGLAVFIDRDSIGRRLHHSGWYPGYNSIVAHWPEIDLTLALQINRDHDTRLREIHAALADLLAERTGAAKKSRKAA